VADGRGQAPSEGGSAGPTEPAPAQPIERARMVHYNGYAKLRVTSPKESIAAAIKSGQEVGAYVETMNDTLLTLRVPVAKFRELFATLVKLGDVLERSMTAEDVTDAYTAADLRLKTLKASRDRLITLLGHARSENEKLQLLAEIRRLTEEVDRLEMEIKTLASLAAFSRLTLQMVPRQAHEAAAPEELAAFRWIRDLSPFRRDVAAEGKRLDLKVPEGMVLLGKSERWTAEGADGAVIWASRRDNEPKGTTEFWLESLRGRLAPEYGSAESLRIGGFQFLRLVDQSEVAYRYLVGVRVDDGKLQLIEIYYPTAEHEKRYAPAIKAALEGGAS
jgi:hypothetical protein